MKKEILGLMVLSSICFGADIPDWKEYIKNNENQVKVTKLHTEKIKLSSCPTITALGSNINANHNAESFSSSTVFYGCLEKAGSIMVIESAVEYPSSLPYNASNPKITNYPYITNFNAEIYINSNITNIILNQKNKVK